MKYRLLIFDLDGTLIDSKRDIANAVNHALELENLPPLDNKLIYSFIGDGMFGLIEKTLSTRKEYKQVNIEKLLKLYAEYYNDHLLDSTVLYPGVKEILEHYRKYKKAIVSNKEESFSRKILEKLNVCRHFDIIFGSNSTKNRKPDPEPLIKVMDLLNVGPEETIMIGDGINDIIAALKANVKSCIVTHDPEVEKEFLAENKPDFCINSLIQLKGITNPGRDYVS